MAAWIRGIRSVEVDVSSLAESIRFYRDVWNLRPVQADKHSAYLRGTCEAHHIFSVHEARTVPAIRRVVLDVKSRPGIDELHQKLCDRVTMIEKPGAIPKPLGGYGFGFKDIEGRNFVLVCDGAQNDKPMSHTPDLPTKISHINLNSLKYDETTSFFTELLGLRVIDESGRARFFHADSSDHFSIAVVKSDNATLNHIAFELVDLDSVMRGAGRMRDNGYPIEWGVGRHGPGNNVFAYFAGPDEIPIEYTSEVLQIDDSYVPRGPDYWTFPSGRTDQWGVTNAPSARLHRIQQLFAFTESGFQTNAV